MAICLSTGIEVNYMLLNKLKVFVRKLNFWAESSLSLNVDSLRYYGSSLIFSSLKYSCSIVTKLMALSLAAGEKSCD